MKTSARLFCAILLLFLAPAIARAQYSVLDQKILYYTQSLTDAEKVTLLSPANNFASGAVPRLGIPGFSMMDGPHGVRFTTATSFPVGIAMAATWDPNLGYQWGQAMGQEFFAFGYNQQLGPCVDNDRDPRFGRSAESGGEEPLLTGRMGAAAVQGIETSPVIATVKHFNGNGRENGRSSINVTISDRNLMEHYGLAFRMSLQEGGAMSIMSSYNLVNGTHSADNPDLLTTILRDRWGYPFYVVSDWGAVSNSLASISAGNDVCMGSSLFGDDLPGLLSSGALSEDIIDASIQDTLRVKLLNGMFDPLPASSTANANTPAHQQLARQTAREGIVLLKNAGGILPLSSASSGTIALIGPSANVAQLDGAGSSNVSPPYSISPLQGVQAVVGASRTVYAQGCTIAGTDTSGFAAAVAAASQANVVIYVGGLDGSQEGEEYAVGDRVNNSVLLPGVQNQLISQLAQANPNLIVILESGGICTATPFVANVKGLLYAFYPGMEGGNALADVLFGSYNPAGRLPVTMPASDAQIPTWVNDWDQDYLNGYHWYDQMGLTPQYAFGFGLSYTTFSYSNLTVSPASASVGMPVTVSFQVKNTGTVAGDEVSQLYVSDNASPVPMPIKQLKAFSRVNIAPGQTQTVSYRLNAEDFYYWDETKQQYTVAPGTYGLKVGGSSDNLPLSGNLTLTAGTLRPDLKITRIFTLPRCPQPGDVTTFYLLVKNQGAGPSPWGSLSTTVSAGGQVVAQNTDYASPIPAGGSALLSVINGYWVAPAASVVPITAQINSGGQVAESDTTNNTLTQNVTVATLTNAALSGNDLALNQPTTASSQQDATLPATNATDGNSNTRWSSAGNVNEQWLQVDLGTAYAITAVRLKWEAAYSTNYSIQVAQTPTDVTNGNWQDVYDNTAGAGGVETPIFSATGRYIRILSHQRSLAAYGVSLWDFNVYGGPVVPPPSLTMMQLSSTATSVALGKSLHLSAAGLDQHGSAFSLTQPVYWTTSNGVIDGNGNFTPYQTGPATITALCGNVTATISINVTAGVRITSALTAQGMTGTAFSYQVTASSTPTGYGATGLPAGLSLNASTGVISGIPSAPGTSNVTISATNASGTGSATLVIGVQLAPPSIALAVNCGGAAAGSFVADNYFTGGSATSVGGTIDTSTVANPAPQAVYQSNRYGASTYTLSGFTPGTTYTVRLHFAETYFSTAGSRMFNVSINGTQVLTNFDIVATSGAGHRANIQSFSLPPNSSGQFVIATANVKDNAQINGIDIDNGGNAAQSIITSSLTASGAVGSPFNYQIAATNSPTSFNATGLPAGLSVNTTTGVISGTPSASGTSNVPISATNPSGTNSATLVLSVSSAPLAPLITSALTASGSVGSAFTYQITATNSPTSYNATGLPAGLSVNTSTGLVSGTPSASGTSNITISAINASGTGSATLVLSIPSAPLAPAITSALTASSNVGSSFTYQITATNSPTSYNATGLPAGLSMNTSTGVIFGTPSASGTNSVTVSAANASGTGSATLVVTVQNAASSTVAIDCGGAASGSFIADMYFAGGTSASSAGTVDVSAVTNPAPQAVYLSNRYGAATYTVPGFTSGTTYTVRLHFAETYWTHAGQRLFNVAINGTPVLTNFDIFASTGASFKATVQSFNLQPNASGQFVVALTNVVDNAVIDGIEIYPVTSATIPVVTSALTATGTAGFPFSYQIAASNSPASYSATGLPAGLSLNTTTGVISGIPSASGASNVAISAVNSSGTGSATLALTVQPYPSLAAVNCGGAAAGNFIADTYFTGGTATTANGTIDTSAAAIPAPQSVYLSNRYGAATYTLPGFTPGTTYTVRLHFAETYYSTAGIRTFNVLINGTQVLTNFDILATSGASYKANIQSFNLAPSASGQFVIQLVNVKDNAQINGIEIDTAQPAITSSLTASGTVGSAFSYQIAASNTPASYSATGLPAGLSVNGATGVISGTPTTAATTSVTLSATNASGTGSATLVLAVNASGAGDTNLALGRSATASTFQAGNLVANANDGSATTRWAASDGTFPQWWLVDLGANKTLSRCDIAWYGATTRAYKYRIEVSTDNVNFTTGKDNTVNTTFGNTSDSFVATARYVRITVTGSTSGFASAYEIAVFGH